MARKRKGWARSHVGKVLVLNREWIRAIALSILLSRRSPKYCRNWWDVNMPLYISTWRKDWAGSMPPCSGWWIALPGFQIPCGQGRAFVRVHPVHSYRDKDLPDIGFRSFGNLSQNGILNRNINEIDDIQALCHQCIDEDLFAGIPFLLPLEEIPVPWRICPRPGL